MKRWFVKPKRPMIALPRIEDCVAPPPPVGPQVGDTIVCGCGALVVKKTLAHAICPDCAAPRQAVPSPVSDSAIRRGLGVDQDSSDSG